MCRKAALDSFPSVLGEHALSELSVRCRFGVVPTSVNSTRDSDTLGRNWDEDAGGCTHVMRVKDLVAHEKVCAVKKMVLASSGANDSKLLEVEKEKVKSLEKENARLRQEVATLSSHNYSMQVDLEETQEKLESAELKRSYWKDLAMRLRLEETVSRDLRRELEQLRESLPSPDEKFTRTTIERLSILILFHDAKIEKRHMNSTIFFNQIRALYRYWAIDHEDNPPNMDGDLRVLLAVATWSNLFTETQRMHLNTWRKNCIAGLRHEP